MNARHRSRTLLTLAAVTMLLCFAFFPAVCEGSVYSDSVIADTSPVIYWDMDANDGTFATDLSSLGAPTALTPGEKTFHATFSGAGPRPADGYANMSPGNIALSVDGTNDTIVNQGSTPNTLPNAGVGISAYSVQTWFNSSVPYSSKVHSYVLGRGETYPNATLHDSVGVGGSAAFTNKLFFYDGNATALPGTRTLSPNTWYHTVFVRDGNDVQVYLNGQPEISGTVPWAGGGTGDKIVAGGRADYFGGNGPLSLTGRVDEAAVWDRALTGGEAALLYQSAGGAPPPPPTLYDDFSTDPNIATDWTNTAHFGSTGTATWNSGDEDLDLAGGGGNRWSLLRRTAATRGATDPVTMQIIDYSPTVASGDWATTGLGIISDPTATAFDTVPRYLFLLTSDGSGNGSYSVRRDSNVSLFTSSTFPLASLTFPITLDIVRNGDDYDFKVDGSTLYTATYYSAAQHDSMPYYHISWGNGGLAGTVVSATVDNFGVPPVAAVIPEPATFTLWAGLFGLIYFAGRRQRHAARSAGR